MKKVFFVLSAVLCLAACSQKTHRGTIDTPLYEVRNTNTIEVSRIDLTDSTTVLHIEARFTPHWWIKIVSSTFLADENGNQYPIVSAEGIELDKEFWMPASGEAQFTLTFPPMPAGVNSIDFIEGYELGAFRIWGIRLDGKLPKISMPKPEKLSADATLPEIRQEYGKALFKVKVLGYRPDDQMNLVFWEPHDLLSSTEYSDGYLEDDGTFQLEIPLVQTSTLEFGLGGLGQILTVFLEPGKTSECIINLRESIRRNSLYADNRDAEPLIAFTGEYAALNQALAEYSEELRVYEAEMEDSEIAGYDMEQYVGKLIETSEKMMELVEKADIPLAVKEYLKLAERTNLLSEVIGSPSQLAYVKTIAQGKTREEYLEYVYSYAAEAERDGLIPSGLTEVMKIPEAAYTSGYHQVKDLHFPIIQDTFPEIADAYFLMRGISGFRPLDEEQMAKVQQFPDAFRQYIENANADLLATIERNRKIEGYRKNEAEEVADEDLFASIIAPFRGKTILVDFWETWCGPCRNANELMTPLKEEVKDGEHYRLSEKQHDYLGNIFNIQGVPTYLIVDPEGNICWKQTGFPGVETMKAELLKAMGE